MRRLGFFSIALFGILVLAGCEEEQVVKEEKVRLVRAMKISDVEGMQARSFTGRARAAKQVDLAFKVGGPLVSFDMKVGDEVKKGDLLGRIDPATYAAAVDSAKASLARSNAKVESSQLSFERQKVLYEKGHVSKARLDKVVAQLGTDKADVSAAEASLTRANLDLDYTYLRAPFEGVVVQTYVENFENVRSKQRVIRLVDSTQIEMVVDIPESLISLAPSVQTVDVTFDSFPGVLIPATIKEIGTEASATTRTYPVTLIMDQPADIRILPGMAGKATGNPETLPSDAGASSLVIPVSATFSGESQDETFVWTIDESSKTVSKRAVKTGPLDDRGIRIVDGLSPGDWIATAGVHYLKEGQQVRISAQ